MSVLLAVDANEAESACETVRSWSAVNHAHRNACLNGKDMWNTLTARVFGRRAVGLKNSQDERINFFELCKRLDQFAKGRVTFDADRARFYTIDIALSLIHI